jgi:dihydrofolate reductase
MTDKITVSLVVSSSQNGVIGARGKKPWLLPQENQLLKDLVRQRYIILGRKTFETIDRRLIETCNIVVLSRQRDLRIPGVHCNFVWCIVEDTRVSFQNRYL